LKQAKTRTNIRSPRVFEELFKSSVKRVGGGGGGVENRVQEVTRWVRL
jgi:hypothetical protein